MNTAAAIIVIATTSTAAAQDLSIFAVQNSPDLNHWSVFAQFNSALPGGATSIGSIWADTRFVLTGDAPITIEHWNPGYDSLVFGQPQITGQGTDEVEFIGVQPGGGLGTPDPSNPLFVACFDYTGSASELGFDIVGQNSAIFNNPNFPFGQVELYQDVFGNPGSLSFEVVIGNLSTPNLFPDCNVPAPATLSLAPVMLIATRRRR